MAQKRRVYIVRPSHEPVEQDVYSSLTKISDQLDIDLNYGALNVRLHRAEKRTGKKMVRLRDKEGQPITIEVKEVF